MWPLYKISSLPKHYRISSSVELKSYTTTQAITLEEFLKRPETKPASEYIDGEIFQKPMPKGKHSRLQLKLCNVAENQKIAYAFPELRCSFGTRSVVSDVAVFE